MIKIYNRIHFDCISSKIKLAEIGLYNEKMGDVFSLNKLDSYNPQWITTELRGKYNKLLGKEIFSIKPELATAEGAVIETSPEYRQRGFRIGEILRLSSIMNIIENNIKEFKINSKPTAVYFHTKYKFQPNITRFNERDRVLLSIQKTAKDEFEEFSLEAKKLENDVIAKKDGESQRELCRQTSDLLRRYLQRVLETKADIKQHQLLTNVDMVLTKEEIIKNKVFFNGLFINHGLDYRI